MNKNILNKASKETLLLIKEEAEKSLLGIQSVENIITYKSNRLMSVLIGFFIIIFVYSIKSFSNSNIDLLFYISLLLVILLGYVILILYVNILPLKTGINGTNPNQLLQSDIITGDSKSDNLKLLRNRVYSLEKAIEKSLKSHKILLYKFRKANKILIIGISVISIITILYILISFFLPYQCI